MRKLPMSSLQQIATALWLLTPATLFAQQSIPTPTPQSTAPADRPTQTSPPDEQVFHVGGDVKKPKALQIVDATYSKDGLKNKISGNVEVYIVVDKSGTPTRLRIVHGLGYGLDEEALQAVRQYRFQPATRDGQPVCVELYVDVKFWIKHGWF